MWALRQTDGVSELVTRELLGPAEIRALAGELGLRPTKTLGQNFVHDPNTVRRIVADRRLDRRASTCSKSVRASAR